MLHGNWWGPIAHRQGIHLLEAVVLPSIKDRNGIDITEAEDIKKRWQEHTEMQIITMV